MAEETMADDSSSLASQPELPPYEAGPSSADNRGPASQFAVIAMHSTDRLQLIQFPESVYSPAALGRVLVASWPEGVQKHGFYGPAFEYKLKGTPFGQFGERTGVAARRLLRDVLTYLYSLGWVLQTAYTGSRLPTAKDSLLFKKVDPETLPGVEWAVVMTASSDKMRVIVDEAGQRGGVNAPPADTTTRQPDASASGKGGGGGGGHTTAGGVVDALRTALRQGSFLSGEEWTHESFQFKLNGRPWKAIGKGITKQRLLTLTMVETFDRLGWRLYGAIRQRTEGGDGQDTDTWYFVRTKDWVAGSPFNGEPVTAAFR